MISPLKTNKELSGYLAMSIIALSMVVAIAVSILSLNAGCFIIFQNLFYIPIIIASLCYGRKGLLFSIIVGLFYFALTSAYTKDPRILFGAGLRVAIFVLVAWMINYISLKKVFISTLEESRARYRDLVDNLSSGVVVYEAAENGEDFIIREFNHAAEKIEGVRKEDVIGHSVLEVFPGVVDFNLFDTFRRVWRTGISEEHPISRYKDNRITGWRENYVYRLSSGEIVAIYNDVTDKMQAEEILRENTAKYERILKNMQDAYFRSDLKGLIIMANPAAARIFGYDSPEEMIGLNAMSLYNNPEDRETLYNILKEKNEVLDYTAEGRRKDGSTLWVSMNVQSLFDEKGAVVSIEGFIRDITYRKEAEKALLAGEEKYRNLVENISDVILTLDLNGNITYISPVFEKNYGYTQEEVTGEHFSKFICPDDMDRVINAFKKRLKGEYGSDTFRVIASDGSLRYVRTSLTPLMKNGDVTGLNYVLTDFSEIHKVEESLREANKKLNMLSSVTRHDILNSIMIVRGYLELSDDLVDNPELRSYIEVANKAVDTIQKQVEFTRYYENIGVRELEWHDLKKIADNTANQFVTTDIEFKNSLKGLFVYADPLIEKVFYNLIENSMRHGGNVTLISISYAESEKGLKIIYRDNGVGIRAEDKDNIFEKGFGKNTGLGLFLSREILSITGIDIKETGEPGKGVNFEILVPKRDYRLNSDQNKI